MIEKSSEAGAGAALKFIHLQHPGFNFNTNYECGVQDGEEHQFVPLQRLLETVKTLFLVIILNLLRNNLQYTIKF